MKRVKARTWSWVTVVMLLLGLRAEAHPFLQMGLEGTWDKTSLSAIVRVSAEQARLDAGRNKAEFGKLKEDFERYAGILGQGLNFELDGRPLALKVTLLSVPSKARWEEEGESASASYYLETSFPESMPGTLKIGHHLLEGRDGPDGLPYQVGLAVSLRDLSHGKTFYGQADPSHPFLADPAAGTRGQAALAVKFARAGVWHIWEGWDHLLFVSALVLSAISWWDVFRLVLAFTLAHSLTLTLAVLGLVRLPPWLVEPGISLSIVAVASLNLLPRQDQAIRRGRLASAFGFGLLHGLGFAGGLLEVMRELPALRQGLSIAGFSLGVEAGHLSVVLPLFALLSLGRAKTPQFHPSSLRYGSLAIALAGLWYLSRAVGL